MLRRRFSRTDVFDIRRQSAGHGGRRGHPVGFAAELYPELTGLTGDEGEIAVYLYEIKGPLNAHGIERGFRADRFAPLQSSRAETEEELMIGLPDILPA